MALRRFHTVAQARRQAQRTLPASVFRALEAGSEQGLTAEDNVRAFDELGLAPCGAVQIKPCELGTTVMGVEVSLPVVISPLGVQAVNPEGELPVARAAAAVGTVMGLSCFASRPVEQVVALNPRTLFQMHWVGPREVVMHSVEMARAAGAMGLILTLDWSFSHGRDRTSPVIPEDVGLATMLRFTPEVLVRPRWLLAYARAGRRPDLRAPNLALPGEDAPGFFTAYRRWEQAALPTWDDVAWLARQWDGPFMLKGIMRVDDAKRALDAGVTAVSVSNHGGNNLDGTPASIRALAAVAEAVGDQAEVLLDGGIRRGSDVVKALALGARAVMIGRPYLWGLAANGQTGVEDVFSILRGGLETTLAGIGKSSVHDLSPDDIVVPAGFARRLGVRPTPLPAPSTALHQNDDEAANGLSP